MNSRVLSHQFARAATPCSVAGARLYFARSKARVLKSIAGRCHAPTSISAYWKVARQHPRPRSRFQDRLTPQSGQPSPAAERFQPASTDDENGERQPQFQLFDQARLLAYVRHLAKKPQSYVMGFDRFDAGHDWNSDAFPLALCEFLAYKSALAYERPARIEQNLLREHPRGISDFKFFDSRNRYGHTQAFGFVLSGTAYMVFRGTEFLTWADWATDFDTRLTTKLDDERYEREKRWIGAREPGRHTGFAIAWGHVRGEVYAWIDQLLDSRSADRIVLSGHSLGGALAKLAAFDFATHPTRNYEIGAVITFGAPLVGDETFKAAYESAPGLARRTIRIAASLDLITMLTLAPFTYRHVGREWHLNKRPAYSRWRMYFFTPLLDPTEEAEKKVKAKRQSEQDQSGWQRAGVQSGDLAGTAGGLVSDPPAAPGAGRTQRQPALCPVPECPVVPQAAPALP